MFLLLYCLFFWPKSDYICSIIKCFPIGNWIISFLNLFVFPVLHFQNIFIFLSSNSLILSSEVFSLVLRQSSPLLLLFFQILYFSVLEFPFSSFFRVWFPFLWHIPPSVHSLYPPFSLKSWTIIALKFLLSIFKFLLSGLSWVLFLFTTFSHNSGSYFLFLFSRYLIQFSLYFGYCKCYVVGSLDSLMFLWRVIIFALTGS